MKSVTQTSLRVPAELIARIDELVDKLAEGRDPMFVSVKRSDLLRMALMRGMDVIEAELAKQGRQSKG